MWLRISKELRCLVVPWTQAIGLVLLAILWGQYSTKNMVSGAFWLWCFLVASRIFGAEFDDRTLPHLLSQPISRTRIWAEKMLVATLLILLGGVALASLQRFSLEVPDNPEWWHLPLLEIPGWLHGWMPLIALATAPAVSLWLRDSLRTLWASMILPMVVYLTANVVWALASSMLAEPQSPTPALILAPYCAVMLILGYRRFQRLEITAYGSAPGARLEAAPTRDTEVATVARPSRRFLLELAVKEMRLQRSILLLIPVLTTLWIVFWLLSAQPAVAGSLISVGLNWMFPAVLWVSPVVLILVVPALLGASAIATERQLGVIGWQLSLPVSRRLQWRLKLVLSLFPALLSALIGLAFFWLTSSRFDLPTGSHIARTGSLGYGSLLGFAAGLYSSRHGRSSFQALGFSLIVCVGLWYLWRLLRYTSWAAATFWPYTFKPLLDSSQFPSGGLVDLAMGGLLFAILWRAPPQEGWITGRGLLRSFGLAAPLAVALAALATQAYIFSRTAQELEREIIAKNTEIAAAGDLSRLAWLAEKIGLPSQDLSDEVLITIIDFTTYSSILDCMMRLVFLDCQHLPLRQPVSRFMNLSVWADGVDISSSAFDRWYWLRSWHGVLYSGLTDRFSPDYPSQRGTPTPARPFSIAPLCFQKQRQQRLDQRVRQNVFLEAMRTGRQLEHYQAVDPDGFSQLLTHGLEAMPHLSLHFQDRSPTETAVLDQ